MQTTGAVDSAELASLSFLVRPFPEDRLPAEAHGTTCFGEDSLFATAWETAVYQQALSGDLYGCYKIGKQSLLLSMVVVHVSCA